MTTFDEFQQDRVINVSMTLRQENDHTLLGPAPGALTTKAIIILSVLESFAFGGILLYFFIGPGDIQKNAILMVALLVVIGLTMGSLVVGVIMYDRISVAQKLRFHLKGNGEIIIKNANGSDVTLNGKTPMFNVESTIDRNGNDVHDVFMQYGDDTHYIVSGFDRDKMIRLRDDLQEVCKT